MHPKTLPSITHLPVLTTSLLGMKVLPLYCMLMDFLDIFWILPNLWIPYDLIGFLNLYLSCLKLPHHKIWLTWLTGGTMTMQFNMFLPLRSELFLVDCYCLQIWLLGLPYQSIKCSYNIMVSVVLLIAWSFWIPSITPIVNQVVSKNMYLNGELLSHNFSLPSSHSVKNCLSVNLSEDLLPFLPSIPYMQTCWLISWWLMTKIMDLDWDCHWAQHYFLLWNSGILTTTFLEHSAQHHFFSYLCTSTKIIDYFTFFVCSYCCSC